MPPTTLNRRLVAGFILGLLGLAAAPAHAESTAGLDTARAGQLASLALECVHREYPNKISHVMQSDKDLRPPRELTPAFFGCYDWHSSVHGHWLLARLARTYPDEAFAAQAVAALEVSLTPVKIAVEVRYLQGKGRTSFERPYGLAWLLQLAAELRQWDSESARRWSKALAPLEEAAGERIAAWLPNLTYPIRTGEHSQTAFAFGLILDWTRIAAEGELEELLTRRISSLYLGDRDCPLTYEPSGQDFLSPCIAEADLMRRVLEPVQYGAWLGRFLPTIPSQQGPSWFEVAIVTDRSDPKLAHLDGLNLSRAWMLDGVASGLPPHDPRRPALRAAVEAHRSAGLAAVTGEYYEGGHWLGSFATYLVTRRGVAASDGEGLDRAD
jgi:hypothetical protein